MQNWENEPSHYALLKVRIYLVKYLKKIIILVMAMFSFVFIAGCGNSKEEPVKPAAENTTKNEADNKAKDKVNEDKSDKDKKPKKEKTPEPFKPVVISFAGDCTLGGFPGSAEDFDYYWRNGPGYYLGNVKPIFETDDITFVNLEGPLTLHPRTAIKTFPMRGEPEYVEILKSASVEICNLSNNHIYDCGDEGFQDTVNVLKANNIKFCGEGYSDVIDIRGLKVGFLGYQGWEDYPELRSEIANDIIKMRKDQGADVVIVEFHWGIEGDYTSYSIQDNLAHSAIDSGADIVVGAHPHVVQGLEVYKGKIIAYSLGNFCFGGNANPSDKDTFILQTTINKQGNNIVINPKIIPCFISSTNSYNDYCPTPAEGYEAERILNKLANSSSIYPQTINFVF